MLMKKKNYSSTESKKRKEHFSISFFFGVSFFVPVF